MFDESKIKHLEFIQSIITRMASNSFMLKGWAITVVAALLAYSIKEQNPYVLSVILFPAIVFALLDMYYLYQERLFRKLYDKVREQVETDFAMSTEDFKKDVKYWPCLKSPSIYAFYVPIVVLLITMAIIILIA